MERDSWMLGPGKDGARDPLGSILGGDSPKKQTKDDKPKISSRELNPYFKAGGTGLPPGAEMLTRTSFKRPGQEEERDTEKPNLEREDLNMLTARKLKAEMMGDERLASEMQSRIKALLSDSKEKSRDTRASSLNLKEERETDTESYDRQIATQMTKRRFESMEDFSDSFRAPSKRGTDRFENVLDEKRHLAMKTHLRMEKIQEKCEFCLESEVVDMSTVIAMGHYAYLAAPRDNMLNPLHCIIVPNQHVSSMTGCDDAIWDEVRNFKKCLLSLGATIDQTVLFLEVAPRLEDATAHTHIDAVFLPKGIKTDPRGFFHKALLECDEEWSSHKRIIDTTEKGGLCRSIPKNFPYCYVDFRLDQGFVHIIEDNRKIGMTFLLELASNLLNLQRHEWRGRRPSKELVDKFQKLYAPFDWTKLLHDESPS
jgi:hypothetical protein